MILTYHEIVAEPSRYVYSVTAAQFAQHLASLRVLPNDIPQPTITFDDGHVSHQRYALPRMERHGFKGTFFVTAGWTGERREYMGWGQLRELLSCGHEVQSHSWSHAVLTHCSPLELEEELRRSRFTLEDRLGCAVDAISIPGGRWNNRVLAACRQQGYRRVFVSDPYLAPQVREGIELAGRSMVRRSHGIRELEALLRSGQTSYSRERVWYRTKQLMRSILGYRAYHTLWKSLGAASARSAINEGYLTPPK